MRRWFESAQYAAKPYRERLELHGIRGSMSRKGNPYDNAKAGSFMKTLKHEEVLMAGYRDLADVQPRLFRFIDEVYNERRLHSALGYLPPNEFEQMHRRQAVNLTVHRWGFTPYLCKLRPPPTAAERLREEIGSTMAPSERPAHDRQVRAARAALADNGGFDRCWKEGRTLPLEQAIELAMLGSIRPP